MPTIAELYQQGRNEELWQMSCGFTGYSLEEFMAIQKRLMQEQLELLNRCTLGEKVMRGAKPRTIEEFREQAPITSYADYLPELMDKREDILPAKPLTWVHTSGKSGEYACKWLPITEKYANELSILMYALGNLANCQDWGDTSHFPYNPKLVYTVAPPPYMSGTMANFLALQSPVRYIPSLKEAESLSFEDRIALGFKQALSTGIEYFFGLSLVLVAVGEKFSQSSGKTDIRPLLAHPKALWRLAQGKIKSKLAGRPMLPKDLWAVRGIISSGLDSTVYREKIKNLWGRYPLDVYASTEQGIVATQTWDHDSMTFVPNMNFLEFIPEDERLKWLMDQSYQPKTLLLDEVKAGECYEIVTTGFHGGATIRYKVGDIIKITSLRNERLGIDIPQMVFERRADDLIDFVVTRLTEKTIWQAIENSAIAYEDWVAYKEAGEAVLRLFIEPKEGYHASEAEIAEAVYPWLIKPDDDSYTVSRSHEDLEDMIDFKVKVTLLPRGSFANYTATRRALGAELAHLKPPHINPSGEALSLLVAPSETEINMDELRIRS